MLLTLEAVGHHFPDQPWLFRGLNASLESNRSYSVSGPSGSGKSTLLSLLASWTAPVEGVIRREGVERVSWVFQNPHGVPRRNALDHVTLPLLARGADVDSAESAARAVLERFDLDRVADREFRTLSGGEAQRLMLARAVAVGPDLLLVDEPTAQLDPDTARSVNDVLQGLVDADRIVVVATHDPATRGGCTDHIDLSDVVSLGWRPAKAIT